MALANIESRRTTRAAAPLSDQARSETEGDSAYFQTSDGYARNGKSTFTHDSLTCLVGGEVNDQAVFGTRGIRADSHQLDRCTRKGYFLDHGALPCCSKERVTPSKHQFVFVLPFAVVCSASSGRRLQRSQKSRLPPRLLGSREVYSLQFENSNLYYL